MNYYLIVASTDVISINTSYVIQVINVHIVTVTIDFNMFYSYAQFFLS